MFCFTEGEKFLSDSYDDIDMTFFSLSSNGTEEVWNSWSSITLSNFRMFWNCFCSKVRSGVGVEPILTRKHASLPQNLLCHNSLRQTKNFRTVENILWIYSSSQGSSSPFNTITYILMLLFVFSMDYDTRN